jgi:NAD(P)-dependent dehydrogenase (short-subunit alcohol dehydrogenase family)
MNFAGRVAVITGAAGGIGRAIALSLSARGCHLALADVNESGLAETAAMARTKGVTTTLHRLDVADRAEVAALPEAVRAAHGRVDLLVNNAGVALGGAFADVPESDFEWLFEINFWGVVRMTRAFLPLLTASDDARIINLSSLFGLISPPGQTAYSASKFAVRGFSNALRFELAGTPVGVTVAHPGGVATSIAKNARVTTTLAPEEVEKQRQSMDRLLRLPPEKAGEIIVRAVERRRPRVIVGTDAKVMAILERLSPVSYLGVIERMMAGS